jgi:pimeloyl-ACP methyl ester carboxylesterase
MKWILLVSLTVMALTIVAPSVLHAAEPPKYLKRQFAVEGGESLKYVVYVPADLDPKKPVPLLIFLHGSSADCVTHERILKESNLQFWHGYGRNVQREPTILMAPVGGRGGWTSEARRKAVFGIIDGLIKEFPVNRQRIYLQGFSMGGAGSWDYLQQRPSFFAAANPQALGGRKLDAAKVKNTPIWATVGADDRRWLPGMKATVAAVRAANGDDRGALTEVTGVNPRFSVFPKTNHGGAQGATQKIPGFMDWMYAQVNDGNIAPNVRFVQPALGDASETGTVKAVVVANDPEGKLAKVEFYLGEKLVSERTEAPYEFTYSDLPDGAQTLKAKAVDAGGKSRTAELQIQIGKKPATTEEPGGDD